MNQAKSGISLSLFSGKSSKTVFRSCLEVSMVSYSIFIFNLISSYNKIYPNNEKYIRRKCGKNRCGVLYFFNKNRSFYTNMRDKIVFGFVISVCILDRNIPTLMKRQYFTLLCRDVACNVSTRIKKYYYPKQICIHFSF